MENELTNHKTADADLGVWSAIWAGLGFGIILVGILGVGCLVLGITSILVEPWTLDMYVGGMHVETTAQKALFTGVGAAICAIAIGFWWLRQRGYVAAVVILYVAIGVIVYALSWVTGSNDLLSVSW